MSRQISNGRFLGVLAVSLAAVIAAIGCFDGGAFIVNGPPGIGNTAPTLTFLEPIADVTRGQGQPFLIRWADSDPDSSASISFSLINIVSSQTILLISDIEENDSTGQDTFTVTTSLIPEGTYHLFGVIDDDQNAPVTVYAETTADANPRRVEVRITGGGQTNPTTPPQLVVTQPSFNLSVTQDDVLTVSIQPTTIAPPAVVDPENPITPPPYDPDSDVTAYLVLDTDTNPGNDDPANPNASVGEIIVLDVRSITSDQFAVVTFQEVIDLNIIPPRPAGQPYYIRVTLDDLTNPRVHQYADGTISVVQLASGLVDLSEVGKSISGSRIYGFNPQASLGSSMSGVSDFDQDGVDDFVLVAQFGNPRNFGLVGEAYLLYGQDNVRFGGAISSQSVSSVISGCVFEGSPIRIGQIGSVDIRSDGITDVSWIPDLTGDGRPEIIFGQARVHGAVESTDFDTGDTNVDDDDSEEEVTVLVRAGLVQVTDLPDNPVPPTEVDDLVISSATPNQANGSGSLVWGDDGTNQEYTLLKFSNVLNVIPDSLASIDISTVQAELQVRVFNTGGNATVYQSLTDFNESTTYSTYAENGGAPELGVDYDEGEGEGQGLGSIAADTADTSTLDISALVRSLIDSELSEFDDELRFIFIPPTNVDDAEQAGIRSSEFPNNPEDRPTLVITYTRNLTLSALNCYPDDIVNNFTDGDNEGPPADTYFYAGGMAMVVNSQNRDEDSVTGINPARLEKTTIALELVGQQSGLLLGGFGVDQQGGAILARASNFFADNLGNEEQEAGRVSGFRLVNGFFDSIDARFLGQPPRNDLFGQDVASIGDLNFDGLPEIVVSSPTNELYLADLLETYGPIGTHLSSTAFRGSITVVPGANYNNRISRDKNEDGVSTSLVPRLDSQLFPHPTFGDCVTPVDRLFFYPSDSFSIFAEDPTDFLGDGQSAGDVNQDGVPDILCGAPFNDRGSLDDAGAVYILYGKTILGDYQLANADNPVSRPPMIRIRGEKAGDRIGFRQSTGQDINGDNIDDVFFSSPFVDFGGITRSTCGQDANGDGVINSDDFSIDLFETCEDQFGGEVFSDDVCKVYDYDNDGDIDEDDNAVRECLEAGGSTCCNGLVDNGFVGVVFGGVFLDGDRVPSQLATTELPGCIFFGAEAGHRAGFDVSSAGDFNEDGFGDMLITVPGEKRVDSANRERTGVVYLVFGGTHLTNKVFNLSQVGTEDLPGIVFTSPYVSGRPNEAAPERVALLGDINNDGFDDIAIGNPKADFIDLSFPQGPDAPGNDPAAGRRSNAGDVYIIYGNNFGSNRVDP